jgi:hypothetical protein
VASEALPGDETCRQPARVDFPGAGRPLPPAAEAKLRRLLGEAAADAAAIAAAGEAFHAARHELGRRQTNLAHLAGVCGVRYEFESDGRIMFLDRNGAPGACPPDLEHAAAGAERAWRRLDRCREARDALAAASQQRAELGHRLRRWLSSRCVALPEDLP